MIHFLRDSNVLQSSQSSWNWFQSHDTDISKQDKKGA